MNSRGRIASALCVLTVVSACQSSRVDLKTLNESPTAIARATRLARALAEHDTTIGRGMPLAQWEMPSVLQEISGLALTRDGRLLVHGDELGQIWEIDFRRGILVKEFSLGKEALKSDFESIAVAGDDVFLLNSKGKLYQFREGSDASHVTFTVIETGLAKECEFEGMTFDPTINSLLLACKKVHGKASEEAIVIFRWSLAGDANTRLSKMSIPLARIVGSNDWDAVHPSDIAVDPTSGNYVLVASAEKAIMEITPAGAVVFARPLPVGHHQAEGVAITRDSVLIVSDEGGKQPAKITLYRWP